MPPIDLDLPRMIAILLIFALWALYGPILDLIGKGSLNTQLHAVRRQWLRMHHGTEREHRVFDAILMGHISNSVSFFGSATLLVLAGLVGTLVNIKGIYHGTRELGFLDSVSEELFTLHFAVLTLILALCFFAFTYALRKMAYTFALMGGLQEAPAHLPEAEIMVEKTATVLTEAVRSINAGIRGFYFAVAALFLFAGPWVSILMTLLITGVLFYRQLFSPTARAIGSYVEALNRITERSRRGSGQAG